MIFEAALLALRSVLVLGRNRLFFSTPVQGVWDCTAHASGCSKPIVVAWTWLRFAHCVF